MSIAYIALGSNLKQPASQIQQALIALQGLPQTKLLQNSSLYLTPPVGYDNQPDFINAVAELETTLEPAQLLQYILDIESGFGRERPFPNAPRVLDLDLLLYDELVMQTPALTVPHPRMHLRGFVMLPLAEIAPDLMIPKLGNVVELLAKLDISDIKKID
ncbi:MAG: 2-amino-4-hydroxy-6-hydroxymethyldihydropteridine diphosphokinase [Methylophilus sp.]